MKYNWKEVLFKIYEATSIVFLIVVALLGIVALYSKVNKEAPLRFLSVISGSMRPSIDVGSAVIIAKQPNYNVNDVITYKLEEKLVTHRIIYSRNYILTKGDANRDIDKETVDKKNIIGKVIVTLPYLGRIQEATKNGLGLIIFIILPSVLIILHETFIILREVKKLQPNFNFANKKMLLTIGIFAIFFASVPPDFVMAYYSTIKNGLQLQISTGTFSPSSTPITSPTPTSTLQPTMSPTVSPSASPSSTSIPSPTGIGNTGNGAGSTNTVIINNSSSTTVNQSNTSTQTNTVINNSNTGNNSGGDVTTATSSANTTINNQSNSNTVVIE